MKERKFDLSERTERFSKSILRFLRQIKVNTLNRNLIDQLIRSGTSSGSNYHEADSAESKKDFIHKIGICKKESRESGYWLSLLLELHPEYDSEITILKQESRELFLIFTTIVSKSRLPPLEISN